MDIRLKTVASYGRLRGSNIEPWYIEARKAWLVRNGVYTHHVNRGVALEINDVFVQRHQDMMWLCDEMRPAGDVEWLKHTYHGCGTVTTDKLTVEQAEDFLRDTVGLDLYDRDVLFGRREPAY